MKWLSRTALAILAASSLAYAFWLGRVAWFPIRDVIVEHDGKVAEGRVYESAGGLISFEDPCGGPTSLTLAFPLRGRPIQVGIGSAFRDYGLFAIPLASGFGRPIAADDVKTLHDPKARWVSFNTIEFIDFKGHRVTIQLQSR